MTPSVSEIVVGLTEASRRAIPLLSADWQDAEHPRVLRLGCYSLGWGKDAGERLIERRWTQRAKLEVRLTARGLEVQSALLQATEKGNRP